MMHGHNHWIGACLLLVLIGLSACGQSLSATESAAPGAIPGTATTPATRGPAVVTTHMATATRPAEVSLVTGSPTPVQPEASATGQPTAAPTRTQQVSPSPTSSPTPDRAIACSQRMPTDDLLAIVTLTYGISRDFAPHDLVPLADYFGSDVTLGYPSELRAVATQPLVEMISAMQAEGLKPSVISGYRSYSAQAIARQKWVTSHPESADILSALPGHSEHQLGTVIDMGSPELPGIVGQEDIQFHTWFYKTSEGIWLAENAHRFGFTLSYPFEAQGTTGFFYEPWHYRYVGPDLATQLKEQATSLTEYQLQTELPPCIPDNG